MPKEMKWHEKVARAVVPDWKIKTKPDSTTARNGSTVIRVGYRTSVFTCPEEKFPIAEIKTELHRADITHSSIAYYPINLKVQSVHKNTALHELTEKVSKVFREHAPKP